MPEPSSNLAPGPLIFAAPHTVAAAAATGRFRRQIEKRQDAEALVLIVSNPPTIVTSPPTVGVCLQLLFLAEAPADVAFTVLPNGLYVPPGCEIIWPLPGWIEDIYFDMRAVDMADMATQVEATARVVCHRMAYTTRREYRGRA